MKFTVKKISRENTPEIMRQARYRYVGQSGEQMSFVRPLSQNSYPRFHVYLKENETKREVSIALHLDQKGMSYRGATAHSGEYEGGLLEKEAERLKELFAKP